MRHSVSEAFHKGRIEEFGVRRRYVDDSLGRQTDVERRLTSSLMPEVAPDVAAALEPHGPFD